MRTWTGAVREYAGPRTFALVDPGFPGCHDGGADLRWHDHRPTIADVDDSRGRPDLPDSWADAANEAEFEFFEAKHSKPSHRWSGGFGYSHDGPGGLEIVAQVEGHQVSVETTRAGNGLPHEIRRSVLLNDLVVRAFDLDRGQTELPQAVTLDSEDRTILVDGEPTAFEGHVSNQGAWIGIAGTADGRQVVVRALGPVSTIELVRCANWAMPEGGPPSL